MALVDVVVVSYNSRSHLRTCVAPLTRLPDVLVIVVDNASSDGSLDSVSDLQLTTVSHKENRGFAAGCNGGWREGGSPYVLFLNPDATIDEGSLRDLVAVLEKDTAIGAVAPRVEYPDGSLAWSQRRFPQLRSTFARAVYLHRLFPRAAWSDEIIRDEHAYAVPGSPDWVSGACVLVRRSALEKIGGWDDGFFLYAEDIDLCRRLRNCGYELRYDPSGVARHAEGGSTPGYDTLPLLATSRLRYGYKHRGRMAATLERFGLGLEAVTHVFLSRGGLASRAAHVKALRAVLSGPARHPPSARPT